MSNNNKVIRCEKCDDLIEKIRLAHYNSLRIYIMACKDFNRLRDKSKEPEMYDQILRRYFYDETVKPNWEIIRLLMPQSIEENIKKEYNMLNESEIKLYCLLLLDVHRNDIAYIMQYTKRTVHTVTHNIRHKTGMKDIRVTLKKFVDG